jgi:hypothetical protein
VLVAAEAVLLVMEILTVVVQVVGLLKKLLSVQHLLIP